MNDFKFSYGSVIGCQHKNLFKNNQDNISVVDNDKYLISIIADGCGSAEQSEVGSALAVKHLTNSINYHLKCSSTWSMESIVKDSLIKLKYFLVNLVYGLESDIDNRKAIIYETMLFTIIGVIMNEKETFLFSVGDGVIDINGEVINIDCNNSPNYIGYSLLDHNYSINFNYYRSIPTKEVDSVIIASDGINDILNKRYEIIDGDNNVVGEIKQFLLLLNSKFGIKRRLNVLSNKKILHDDTTLIAIKRCVDYENSIN